MRPKFEKLLTERPDELDDLCRCLSLGGGLKSEFAVCDLEPHRANTDKRFLTIKPVWGLKEVARHSAKGTWVMFHQLQQFLLSRGWTQVRDSFYDPPGPPSCCTRCERYTACVLEGRKLSD